MNRFLFAFLVLVSFPILVNAQVKMDLIWGATFTKTGFNLDDGFYSGISRHDEIKPFVKIGATIGLEMLIPLDEQNDLKTGVTVSNRNFAYRRTYWYKDAPKQLYYQWMDYSVVYLEIPVMLSAPFKTNSRFSFQGGMNVSIGISGTYQYSYYSNRFGNEYKYKETNPIGFAREINRKNLDKFENTFGVLVPIEVSLEGGLVYRCQGFSIFANIRQGLSNIYSPLRLSPTITPDNTGRLFVLMTGLKLPIM
jgi:hypothetical protein